MDGNTAPSIIPNVSTVASAKVGCGRTVASNSLSHAPSVMPDERAENARGADDAFGEVAASGLTGTIAQQYFIEKLLFDNKRGKFRAVFDAQRLRAYRLRPVFNACAVNHQIFFKCVVVDWHISPLNLSCSFVCNVALARMSNDCSAFSLIPIIFAAS